MKMRLLYLVIILHCVLTKNGNGVEADDLVSTRFTGLKPCAEMDVKKGNLKPPIRYYDSGITNNWRCLRRFEWIDFKGSCAYYSSCQLLMWKDFPNCGTHIGCVEANLLIPYVAGYINTGKGESSLEHIRNEVDDLCEIQGQQIADCEAYEDYNVTFYVVWDKNQNVRWLRSVSEIAREEANDWTKYKCLKTANDVDCSRCGADDFPTKVCKGDEYYSDNFKVDDTSPCHCTYEHQYTRTSLKTVQGTIEPRGFWRGNMRVKRRVLPKEGIRYGCAKCHAECTKEGLEINSGAIEVKHYLVCGNPSCKSGVVENKNDFNVILSRSMIIEGGNRHIELWSKDNDKIYEMDVLCQAVEKCDTINCIWCKEFISIVSCYGPAQYVLLTVVTMLTAYILARTIWILEKLVKGCYYLIVGSKAIMKILTWPFKRCWRYKEKFRMTGMSIDNMIARRRNVNNSIPRFDESFVSAASLAIFSMCLIGVASCSISAEMASQTKMCSIKNGKETCTITGSMRIALSPVGQDSCLVLYNDDGRAMGTLKISTEKIQMSCDKERMYFVPEAMVRCVSHKRCRGMGDCTESKCEDTKHTDGLDIWGTEKMDKIGRTFCSRVPGCAGNGCGLCADACLWYRYYLENPSDKVYEVFKCDSWTYSARVTVSKQSTTDSWTSRKELLVGEPSEIDGGFVTLISVSEPPQPDLATCFIKDVSSLETGTAPCNERGEFITGKIGEVNCRTESDARKVSKRCLSAENIVNTRVQTESVSCSSKLVSPALILKDTLLPKQMGNIFIYNDEYGVHGTIENHAGIEIQIDVNGLQMASETDKSVCTVRRANVVGCYSCDTGAKVNLTGHTDMGEAMASIKCYNGRDLVWETIMHLKEETSQSNQIIHLNTNTVDLNCEVHCPGGVTKLSITGNLYAKDWSDDTDERETTGNEKSIDNKVAQWWKDLLNTDWLNSWWKRILWAVLLTAILLLLIYLIIKWIMFCLKPPDVKTKTV